MTKRNLADIQINIPLPSAFAGAPGAPSGQSQALIHSLRVVTTKAKDGTVKSTQHLTWPLVAEDFTPELLADINAALDDLGLEISVKPEQAPA